MNLSNGDSLTAFPDPFHRFGRQPGKRRQDQQRDQPAHRTRKGRGVERGEENRLRRSPRASIQSCLERQGHRQLQRRSFRPDECLDADLSGDVVGAST
jgi:hypothetical protein